MPITNNTRANLEEKKPSASTTNFNLKVSDYRANSTVNTLDKNQIESYDVLDNLSFKYAFDLKIGNKIGKNECLKNGYYTSLNAEKDINELHLNNKYINENSIIYRVVLLDEDGNVIERFTDNDMKIEDLLNKYDPERLIADVRDENGNPQAWIKAEALLAGVEKIAVPKEKELVEEPKEKPIEKPIEKPVTIIEEVPVVEEVTKENKSNFLKSMADGRIANELNVCLGVFEGLGILIEGIVDTGTLINDKLNTSATKREMKLQGVDENTINKKVDELNELTKAKIAKKNVADWFDKNIYYEGGYIEENSLFTSKVRKLGNVVGEIVPFAFLVAATGGAAGGAAAAAATEAGLGTTASAIAGGAATGGLVGAETFIASYGKDAETNFNKNMSFKEGDAKAIKSSGAKSAAAGLTAGILEGLSLYNTPNPKAEIQIVGDTKQPPGPLKSKINPTGNNGVGETPLLEDMTINAAEKTTQSEIVTKLINNEKISIDFKTADQFKEEALSGFNDVVEAVNREEIAKNMIENYLSQISEIINANKAAVSRKEYLDLIKLFHPDNMGAGLY